MEILPNPPILPQIQPKAKADDPALKKTSTDFAAMLFAQMFSELRGSANEEDEESLFGGEKDTDLFMNFYDLAVSQKYVATGGNGVAEQLYQQLLKGK
jgi:Rod binding domain-containing protein